MVTGVDKICKDIDDGSKVFTRDQMSAVQTYMKDYSVRHDQVRDRHNVIQLLYVVYYGLCPSTEAVRRADQDHGAGTLGWWWWFA